MYVDSCNTIEISSSWVLTAIGIAVGQVIHKDRDRDYIIQVLTDWHLEPGWKCARIRFTTVPVTKTSFFLKGAWTKSTNLFEHTVCSNTSWRKISICVVKKFIIIIYAKSFTIRSVEGLVSRPKLLSLGYFLHLFVSIFKKRWSVIFFIPIMSPF